MHLTRDASTEEEIQQEQQLNAALRQLQVGTNDQQDEVIWRWTQDGKFTVKSFYQQIEGGPLVEMNIRVVWEIKAPARVAIFLWIMMQNKILTVENLRKRGWAMPSRCSLCKKSDETDRKSVV